MRKHTSDRRWGSTCPDRFTFLPPAAEAQAHSSRDLCPDPVDLCQLNRLYLCQQTKWSEGVSVHFPSPAPHPSLLYHEPNSPSAKVLHYHWSPATEEDPLNPVRGLMWPRDDSHSASVVLSKRRNNTELTFANMKVLSIYCQNKEPSREAEWSIAYSLFGGHPCPLIPTFPLWGGPWEAQHLLTRQCWLLGGRHCGAGLERVDTHLCDQT